MQVARSVTLWLTGLAVVGAGWLAAHLPATALAAPAAAKAAKTPIVWTEADCQAGKAAACFEVGRRLAETGTDEETRARGRLLLDKGCSLGNADACGGLGVTLANGVGGPKDEERAIALFVDACKRKSGFACANLGAAYANGIGVSQDLPKAAGFLQESCEIGYGRGCGHLGEMYAKGLGVAKDEAKALTWYSRGCKLDDPGSCNGVGVAQATGTGTAKDFKAAAASFERACAAEFGEGPAATWPSWSTAVSPYPRTCNGPASCLSRRVAAAARMPVVGWAQCAPRPKVVQKTGLARWRGLTAVVCWETVRPAPSWAGVTRPAGTCP